MDWSRFPPLPALRAFEATARLGSFSAASRELNVTHAAVSQQVRSLEAFLDVALAFRDGRGIALTDEGAQLSAALSKGFADISDTLSDLQSSRDDQPLRVTLTPSFATKILMPLLGDFWARHPEVPLALHPDRSVVDLRRDGMDLAIRYGTGNWPGTLSECILSARNVIVAAPSLAGSQPRLSIDDMRSLPWVFEGEWQDQFLWLESLGLPPSTLTKRVVEGVELAREAALQGYGLRVDLDILIRRELDAGTLVQVFAQNEPHSGFYLVSLPGRINPRLRRFARWLKSALRQDELGLDVC